MPGIDERCYGHEPAQRELTHLRSEISRLFAERLKDVENHEEAMRALIKILSVRGDVIRNLQQRARNWHEVARVQSYRNRILESCIRADRRINRMRK